MKEVDKLTFSQDELGNDLSGSDASGMATSSAPLSGRELEKSDAGISFAEPKPFIPAKSKLR